MANEIFGSPGNDTLTGQEGSADSINGSGGNDSISGLSGNDTLVGDWGNDILVGGAGNDLLRGEAGADSMFGDSGNDTLDGGEITDRLNYTDLNFTSYFTATTGIVANLQTGVVQDGQGGTDLLVNVNFLAGSGHDDSITGSTAFNLFEQFEGAAGNDTIDGGTIDALGTNHNRVVYYNSAQAVNVNLGTGMAQDGYGTTDTLVNISNVHGGNFGDTLTGSDTTAYVEGFDGRGGNDTINGMGGNDVVRYDAAGSAVTVNLATGTASDGMGGTDTLLNIEGVRASRFGDTLIGRDTTGLANDFEFFLGQAGNDTIDGAGGFDRADYNSSTAGVNVTLGGASDGFGQDGFGNTDTLRNIEAVRGSDFNDLLTGSDVGSLESFEGRAGNDTINGMGGTDRADYQSDWAAVNVNLGTGYANDGFGGTDRLFNIERVRGSLFGDTIIGGGGNDTIEGGGGNDTLTGGEGGDTFVFQANGSQGVDFLSDFVAGDVIEVRTSLAAGVAAGDGSTVTGKGVQASVASGITTLHIDVNSTPGAELRIQLRGIFDTTGFSVVDNAGVTSITYSGTVTTGSPNPGSAGADSLVGGPGNDSISSGEGNDTLLGGGGNDTLRGDNGNDSILGQGGSDTVFGDAGSDVLDGGAILDRISYSDLNFLTYENAPASVVLNLQTGVVAQDGFGGSDTVGNFNFVKGSAQNDTLIGSTTDNLFESFEGMGGNDSIDGGVIGVTGNNSNRASYVFSPGAVSVNLGTGSALDGWGGTDILTNITNVHGSDHADILTGSDTTAAAEGFEGRAGADTINGMGGTDIVRYDGSTGAVNVNLALGTADDGYGFTDAISNIEGVRGSRFADTLTGQANAANTIDFFAGNAGNDTIDGGAGFDRADYNTSLYGVNVTLGGTGNGTGLDGFGGVDTLISIEFVRGSEFADVLTGSDSGSFESLEGRAGNDTMNGMGGTDRADYAGDWAGVEVNLGSGRALDGFGGVDLLFNIENVRGSNFNDDLIGNGGNNDLAGGSGDDILEGLGGNDTLGGGAGIDEFILGAFGDIDRITDLASGELVFLDFDEDLNQQFLSGNDASLLGWGRVMVGTYNSAGNTTRIYAGTNEAAGADVVFDLTGNYSVNNFVAAMNDEDGSALVYRSAAVNLTGTAAGEWLYGSNYDDTLAGGEGNDSLLGYLGNDSLSGGGGDDEFEGDAGNDTIDGGAGIDRVHYDINGAITSSINANLTTQVVTAGAEIDTLVSIEGVTGSQQSDTLIGSLGSNMIWGAEGNDVILGQQTTGNVAGAAYNGVATGGDTLAGEWGNDTIQGGTGNDLLFGGFYDGEDGEPEGADTFVFLASGNGVDRITDFAPDDVIRVNASLTLANLQGSITGSGNSALTTLSIDTNGSAGAEVVIELQGTYVASGFTVTDNGNGTSSIRYVHPPMNLVGTGGNDTLVGGLGNDSISGLGGFDDLTGGSGNDTLDGGADTDVANYQNAQSSVVVDLAAGTATSGQGNDTLVNIESVTTSGWNDTLLGNESSNRFYAGNGADSLSGAGGADFVDGGWGSDTMTGGAGNDLFGIHEGAHGDVDRVLDFALGDALFASWNSGSTSIVGGTNASGLLAGQMMLGIYDGVVTRLSIGIDNNAGADRYVDLVGNFSVSDFSKISSFQTGPMSFFGDIYQFASSVPQTLNGTSGPDTLEGGSGNDTITGLDDHDTLYGRSGDDLLQGGNGWDSLFGGTGNDTLNGGADFDTAQYWDLQTGINFNLFTNMATGDGVDTLISIERFSGSGGNDTVVGDDSVNDLNGNWGNDSIAGNGGDDIVEDGPGFDTLSGGSGNDLFAIQQGNAGDLDLILDLTVGDALFTSFSMGTTTLLSGNNASGLLAGQMVFGTTNAGVTRLHIGIDGVAGADRYVDFNGSLAAGDFTLQTSYSAGMLFRSGDIYRYNGPGTGGSVINGTSGNDNLNGTEAAETINGFDGNDFLSGNGGNDTIFGGNGSDNIDGGAGNDQIDGGTDFQDNDTIQFNSATQGVNVDLGANIISNDGTGSVDTVVNIESVNGTQFGDTLRGNGQNNLFTPGAGNDTVDGGGGFDTVMYEQETAGVNINLLTQSVTGASTGTDQLTSIENAHASHHDDIISMGNNGGYVFARAGNDSITGGTGWDNFFAGSGNDTVNGGDGIDTINYSDDNGDGGPALTGTGAVVNLSTGIATDLWGHTDLLSGIEDVQGGNFNDTLIADGNSNLIMGWGGHDSIDGGGGADQLRGNFGNDTLTGGAGLDLFVVDEGASGEVDRITDMATDDAMLIGFFNNTTTMLSGTNAGGLMAGEIVFGTPSSGVTRMYIGMDSVAGADRFVDLVGSFTAAEFLKTNQWGTDHVGRSGDIYVYDPTAGIAKNLPGTAGNDTLVGGNMNDTLSGQGGNDELRGNAGNDLLQGGAGSDNLFGGLGNDTIDGGTDWDNLAYWDTQSAMHIDLSTGIASGAEGTDTLMSIESVSAGGQNDTIVGDGNANFLSGGWGNDQISGGGGGDQLAGDPGSDTMTGGTGIDLFIVDQWDNNATDVDRITDLERGEALFFNFNVGSTTLLASGSSASLLAGQMVFGAPAGDVTRLYIGTDGNAGADRFVDLVGNFTASQFVKVNAVQGDSYYRSGDSYIYDPDGTVFNITGTNGPDTLVGSASNDTITGLDGNDQIRGQDGNDVLIGGNGDDYIETGGGADSVNAGDGNDNISAGGWSSAGADTIDGGAGTDTVGYGFGNLQQGGNFVAVQFGAPGTSVQQLDPSDGTLDTLTNIEEIHAYGGNFNDTFMGNAARNYLEGNGGNDTFTGNGGNDTFGYQANQANGVDRITDFNSSDSLHFRGLTITTPILSGDNTASLGLGRVMVGATTMIDGVSVTRVYVGTQAGVQEVQLAGPGPFSAQYFSVNTDPNGNSNINYNGPLPGATEGDDTIVGTTANDFIDALGGNDSADGGLGNDSIVGGLGNDTLLGNGGFDTLVGGDGNDLLDGGNEDDTLIGGNGNDTLNGNNGFDYINYSYLANTNGYVIDATGSTATIRGRGDNAAYIEVDSISSIDVIVGSNYNDIIRDLATNRETYFLGGSGNDVLVGSPYDYNYDHVSYWDRGSNQYVVINMETGSATVRSSADNSIIETDTLASLRGGFGTAGHDSFTGSIKDEYFRGAQGNDTMDGAGGHDIASFSSSNVALTVALAEAGVEFTVVDGQGGVDTLRNVEGVHGGSAADVIIGNSQDNRLRGNGGNDTITGGAGMDMAEFRSGAVNITLAAAGTDTLAKDGIFVNGVEGTDTLRSIEALSGNTFNDTLTGNEVDNLFWGRGGNDVLSGGLGNDTLDGGADFDTASYSYLQDANGYTFVKNAWQGLGGTAVTMVVGGKGSNAAYSETDVIWWMERFIGSAGNDTFIDTRASYNSYFQAGLGNDTITGNIEDIDYADYSERDDSHALEVNLGTGVAIVRTGITVMSVIDTDTLVNIRGVWGTQGADSIMGSNGAGVEVFRGQSGNDTIDGAGGADVADYRSSTAGVTITLAETGDTLATDGQGGTDTLRNIEGLAGSSLNDVLTGNAGDNILIGRGGNDALHGGAGIDTVSYQFSGSGVSITLDESGNAAGFGDGEGGTDTITSIENMVGSDSADTLNGNSQANVIAGEDGDDMLRGGAGNDTLKGGSGFDTFDYTYLTGTGADGYNITVTDTQVNISGRGANAAYSEIDTVEQVEQVFGSAGDDVLTDSTSVYDVHFRGGLGNDTIVGSATGFDYAVYTERNSSTPINANLALQQVTIGTEVDTLVNIHNLWGGAGNDVITGDSGTNIFRGRGGNDSIDGAGGNDIVDYRNAGQGVSVTMAEGGATFTVQDGEGGTDSLTNIEGILGSNHDDNLVGNSANNQFRGRNGYDFLDGGAGRDSADYASAGYGLQITLAAVGQETFVADDGEAGADRLVSIEDLFGSDYDDALTGNAADNTLRGRSGNDTLDGGAGLDIADYEGSSGARMGAALNVVLAESGATTVQDGFGSTDTLLNIEGIYGSQSSDALGGNSQANVLRGGIGNDTLTGGAGNDRYDYRAGYREGIDTITDFAAGDMIRVNTTLASAAVATGNGATLSGKGVQSQTVGGVTSLFIDTDNIAGADLQVNLTGTYTAANFTVANQADGSTTISYSSVAIGPQPHTGAVTITGSAVQNQTLTASNTLSDPNGMGPVSYQWLANGQVIAGATGTTFTLAQAQVNQVMSVRASYTDGLGAVETETSSSTTSVLNVNDLPTGGVNISGGAYVGRTVTASNNLADPDGLGTISYQWKADGTVISGATGSSYTLTAAQQGKAITVTASYTDAFGHAESVTSAATSLVDTAPPGVDMGGMIYHWKSHMLMSGVTVTGMEAPTFAASSDLFDLRGTTYNGADHSVTMQVWVNPTVASGSFDFSVTSAAATGMTFTSSLNPADWSLLANPESATKMNVGALLTDPLGSGVTGALQIGTLKVMLGATQTGAEFGFSNVQVGNTNVSAFSVGMENQATGTNGLFNFSEVTPGAYVLGATRDTADSSNAISSADALAALRIAVGINPNTDPDGAGPLVALKVSPFQFIAADANGDGRVNSADALAILRMAVKAPTAPVQKWNFVSETLDLWTGDASTGSSSLTTTAAGWNQVIDVNVGTTNVSQNMVAVLRGDVNGSWAAPTGSVDLDASSPTYFQALGTQLGMPTDVWGV